MADRVPVLFCDGIIDANVTHGVVRITLGQAGSDGKPAPCGQLVLPLTQLPGTAAAITTLVKQVQEKIKAAPRRASATNASSAPPRSQLS